ncbi:MAG: DEAD/DEAH box helicase [Myxococcota bacterium]
MANEQSKGPGRGPGGGKGRPPRGGEREKRRGKGRGERGGRGRDERREGPGAASFRVVTELSTLEKALTKNDLAAQKAPLESILKALKPLRLQSIENLDLNTRGRLITSLSRVSRQPKPPGFDEAIAAESKPEGVKVEAGPSEAPPVDAAPAGERPSEEAAAPGATPVPTEARAEETPAEEAAAAPISEPAQAPAEEKPVQEVASPTSTSAKPPIDEKITAYQDVMWLVGAIWRAVGEEQRAALAFASSGRKADRAEAVKVLHQVGDWREEARVLAEQGRTRDAARIHERQKSFAEAARLFELGKDFKGALRAALAGKDTDAARRLLTQLSPEESRPLLEKAGAWELLMERYIEAKDFDNVAKLYERAHQFDQAALAWEHAGKYSSARKAYERAKDHASAARVRELEVRKLIERGDRLGAAVLQVAANDRAGAVATLSALPGHKAFRFMQKARLDQEALAFARKEIAKAQSENQPGEMARWLELVGEASAAAEAWEKADRKDKAMAMYETAGNWQRAGELAEAIGQLDKAVALFHRAGDKTNAERVAALPRPAPAAEPAAAPEQDGEPAEA